MLLTILLCAALIGVDQLSKYFAVLYLKPVGSAPFIPGIIGLQYLENDGAAFSMLRGRQGLLIVVTGIALAAVLVFLLFRRPKNKWEYLALMLIFSGGMGNLIDRIAKGYVVDYFNFEFVRFAVFNVADSLVVVGFIIFAAVLIHGEYKQKKQREAVAGGEAPPDGATLKPEETDKVDTPPQRDAEDGND